MPCYYIQPKFIKIIIDVLELSIFEDQKVLNTNPHSVFRNQLLENISDKMYILEYLKGVKHGTSRRNTD